MYRKMKEKIFIMGSIIGVIMLTLLLLPAPIETLTVVAVDSYTGEVISNFSCNLSGELKSTTNGIITYTLHRGEYNITVKTEERYYSEKRTIFLDESREEVIEMDKYPPPCKSFCLTCTRLRFEEGKTISDLQKRGFTNTTELEALYDWWTKYKRPV